MSFDLSYVFPLAYISIISSTFYCRKEEVISKWKDLLKLLEKHQKTLMTRSRLRELLRDVEAVINEIKDVEVSTIIE